MPLIILSFFLVVSSLWANSTKYLAWSDYKYQTFEKPRYAQTAADSTLSLENRQLAQAAIYFNEGKFDSALVLYQGLKLAPALQEVVDIRSTQCWLELQNIGAANGMLLKLQGVQNPALKDKVSRLKVEVALRDSANVAVQQQVLERELSQKNGAQHQGWLHFELATLLAQQGQEAAAQRNFVQAWILAPELRIAAFAQARSITQRIGLPRDVNLQVEYVLEECKSAKAERCLQILDTALQNPRLSQAQRVSLRRKEADAFADQKNYAQAAARYQWLVDSVQMRSDYVQTLLRLRRNEGNTAEAKKWENYFHTNYPYSAENANALWVRGFEQEQKKQYARAMETYTKLGNSRFGNNLRTQWAPIRIGIIHLKQNKWSEAYQALERPAGLTRNGWPQAAALYFQGVAMYKAGNNAVAQQKYVEAIESFPLSWYAWLARFNLRDSLQVPPEKIPQIQVLPLSRDSALAWVAQNFSSKAMGAYSNTLGAEVQQYLQTGFTAEAYDLIATAEKKHGKNPLFLFEMGSLLLEYGEIGESFAMARKFINQMERRKMNTLPAPVIQWLYPAPAPWRTAIEQSLAGHQVSPLLVLGLMRQESIFQSGITSPAGARGLLQIMPATGRNLADKEKISDFHPDLLYNPQMSIELGVRYIKDLMDEYQDFVYVLANYNAGPAPAKRWLKANGHHDLDMEVEEISYWETRDYVKRVLGNYWLYQAAWGVN